MKKIRKNDEVVVLSGSSRGTVGRVLKVDWTKDKVWVDKVNIHKVHTKPSNTNPDGGILEKESAIHISNVALKSKGKDGVATKVTFKEENGKKVRIAKKTGKEI